ncbi:MAG: ATP-binding cassette domain-containing protein [Crenarchaeota archaeon]|nr:ATP-binding cassette domain-containing protein [Thermoproteota archaeon]
MKTALELRGIVKKFPHTVALDNVDFDLRYGEIHALLGENGAGKTTLVNIISGVYSADSGEIYLDGKRIVISSPRDAQKLGIVSVSQHPILVDSLTVLENLALALDMSPRDRKFVNELRKVIEGFGIRIDLGKRVWQLSASEKARVEIVKALLRDGKVYIFDEPTSLVGLKDRLTILRVMRQLKDSGKAVLFITHRVDEVFEIADRVTVLRKGKKILTKNVNEVSKSELLEAMFGKSLTDTDVRSMSRKERSSRRGEILIVDDLYVKDDTGRLKVKNISLKVYEGEILGIIGPADSGQRELMEAIARLRDVERGRIVIAGKEVTRLKSSDVRRLGVAYIPDDRLSTGSALTLSVKENLIMRDLDLYSTRLGFYKYDNDRLRSMLLKVGLPEDILDVPCADLSGGMIQRVILARELLNRDVRLVLASYPTQGLDHETTKLVHDMFILLRDKGCSILFTSEDLDEILALSDRIIVMTDGKVVYESDRRDVDVNELREMLA